MTRDIEIIQKMNQHINDEVESRVREYIQKVKGVDFELNLHQTVLAFRSSVQNIEEFRRKAFTKYLISRRQVEELMMAYCESKLPGDADNVNRARGISEGWDQCLKLFNEFFEYQGKVPVDEQMLAEYEKENQP